MKNNIALFLIICTVFVVQHSPAQNPLPPASIEKLENTIRDDMLKSGAPGAVFAIVQGDKILYEKAFGVTNLESNGATATNTVFAIASVTKFFTALALLTAMEKNHIDINSTVGSIVPELSPRLSALTIHHLLSHRAGLIDSWPSTAACKDDLLEYFVAAGDRAIFAKQGDVFSYSNSGYTLAGLLLSRLSKAGYSRTIDSIICLPMQLSRTTFDLRKAVSHSFAAGHSRNPKTGAMIPTPTGLTNAIIQPAGGIFSTIDDLARLAICFMNDGMLDGKKLISSRVIQQMSFGYSPVGYLRSFLGFPNSAYSYGSIVFDRKGIRYVWNGGEAGNLNSLFVMAPEHKTAFLVLSNTGYHPFAPSIEQAMDLVLPAAKEPSRELPRENLESLVGKYYQPNLAGSKNDIIEILVKGGGLLVRLQDTTVLPMTRSDVMTYEYTDPNLTIPLEVRFYPDSSGKVRYMGSFWRALVKLE